MKRAFTLVETLIVLAIIGILVTIGLSSYTIFNRAQALGKDEETIVEVLNQARTQTLSSVNETQYGVHITSSNVTLFTGSSYSAGATGNVVYTLQTSDTILTITLTGGGSDVIFSRLTGETADNGTVSIYSSGAKTTKTVTIYKTGLVESN